LFLIDAGTSYIKTLDTSSGEKRIFPVTDRSSYIELKPEIVTGHNASLFKGSKKVSELVALAEGIRTISKEANFIVLDIGSRDMKLVSFYENNFERCDWNTSCGAMIGFTIELMIKYFNKELKNIPDTDKKLDITCGLLGITKFFDGISKQETIEENLSALMNGMAHYAWHFSGKPDRLYLSGGLTQNDVFTKHMKKLIKELIILDRFTLLEGLKFRVSKGL